jgi:hypothetical protein
MAMLRCLAIVWASLAMTKQPQRRSWATSERSGVVLQSLIPARAGDATTVDGVVIVKKEENELEIEGS